MNSVQKNIIKIYSAIIAAGGIYYLWILLTGKALPCFYYKTTGLLCPGCGVTRMFLSLAKLDIASAFSSNPAAFILFIFWNIAAVLYFFGILKGSRFLYVSFYVSLIMFVGFGIARNFA